MPSEIETLISYNARGNSIARDTFEIEYGQYMTSNHFMITQNCVDPRWNVIKTWTLILMHSYPMPGIPTILPTVVTLIYFLLKLFEWCIDAVNVI